MKIKKNYMLRKVADSYVVVPIGAAVKDFNGMINLNEASALLWQALEQEATEEQLVELLTENYEVDTDIARDDIRKFITELEENNLLD